MCRIAPVISIVCAFVALTSRNAEAQMVKVDAIATVSSSKGGQHSWYEIHADPDSARNMIICGTKWDPKDNAPYGFVYYSPDGGQTWTQVLQDQSSKFVTEQSCAYGVHGVAYFVSDASKVIDDFPHHDLGTTRIYTSRDFGRTWTVGIETAWTDFSTSVVDTMPGPNQNRLYVFFGGPASFRNSVAQEAKAEAELDAIKQGSVGTRVGMISYKVGDTEAKGPFSSVEMGKEKNQGAYPSPAFLLKDGSILTFYNAKHTNDKPSYRFTTETIRTNADRSALESPVKIEEVVDVVGSESFDEGCDLFLNAAGTYDPVHDKLYYVYPEFQNKACHLFLTTSTDAGSTWSKARPIVSPDETPATTYTNPTIAINRDGALAVMWQRRLWSGCWMFAISEDGGLSLSLAKQLGTCVAKDRKSTPLSSAYLSTAIFQADSIHKEGFKAGSARIILRNKRNEVWRNVAIGVSPDGTFHPVWIDAGKGDGEIRTAAIHTTTAAALIAAATTGLSDVTSKVAVLYGGDQHYDAQSGIITVDVVIRNKAAESIRGPFKLVVPSLYKVYGYADIANADNKATAGGAVWDISSCISGAMLASGSTSRPFPLRFHYRPNLEEESPLMGEDFLDFNIKVFAGNQ